MEGKEIKLEDLYTKLNDIQQEIRECHLALEEFNKFFREDVESAVKQIALNKFMHSKEFKEQDRRGENSPSFKQVNVKEMINLYEQGAAVKDLAGRYRISEYTVRQRLKAAGVYKDARKRESPSINKLLAEKGE